MFTDGKSGNPRGRPVGSKNKFSKIREDWLKAFYKGGGTKLFMKLQKEDLGAFLKLGVMMLPKEVEAEIKGKFTIEVVKFAASANPK